MQVRVLAVKGADCGFHQKGSAVKGISRTACFTELVKL